MKDSFESILDESISALQAGVPIEEILAEVPEYASELRPMLFAATLLADPRPELAPEERKAALKAEYLSLAAELPPAHPSRLEQLRAGWHVLKRRLTAKAVLSDMATVSITVALTLAMAALVLGYAAQDTIPGDWLYGVKQISEQTRLLLTFDPADRQTLQDQFNQQRLAEIDQLIRQKRAAVVHFAGTLETKGESLWVIEGLPVFLPADAAITGNPQEGDRVTVVGFLRTNNVMVADTITLNR